MSGVWLKGDRTHPLWVKAHTLYQEDKWLMGSASSSAYGLYLQGCYLVLSAYIHWVLELEMGLSLATAI